MVVSRLVGPRCHRTILATLLAVAITVSAGCSTNLGSQRLRHHDDYFLRSPVTKRFRYERLLDGGSWIKGDLVIKVDKVQWPENEAGTYSISGQLEESMRGHFTTRLAAQEAPRRAVQEAMEPGNVAEVFEVLASRPGVRMTRIHWDRLRSLSLPIDVTEKHPAAPFSSSLSAEAQQWAIEVALLWHKVLMSFLGVPPFGTYTVRSIDEKDDGVKMVVVQDLGQGEPIRYEYSFSRGRSLTGLVAHLRDGTTLEVIATDGRPGARVPEGFRPWDLRGR